MQEGLKKIVLEFNIPGDYMYGDLYGSGHINNTYRITTNKAGSRVRYILQKINTDVFTRPHKLMDNISRVTRHQLTKHKKIGIKDVSRSCLQLVTTRNGAGYLKTHDGHYWRMFLFIEGAHTFDIVESKMLAFEAAAAFAGFQKSLIDLPGKRLFDIIPDFHNTGKRFKKFVNILAKDEFNRAGTCQNEIDFILKREPLTGLITHLIEVGEIPERITHNDTKLNNIMMDDITKKGICVIDLDTVMSGSVLYDYGDLVRTSTSPVAEDEQKAERVTLQVGMFEALTRGYLSIAGDFLCKAEKDNLLNGGKVITLETGIRFLTDYLDGNRYFKTDYPEHNLIRSRTQFRLVESMEKQEEILLGIIDAI